MQSIKQEVSDKHAEWHHGTCGGALWGIVRVGVNKDIVMQKLPRAVMCVTDMQDFNSC